LGLDLNKIGLKQSAMLTLNVDNLFDQNPPYRTSGSGYANGSTLGRTITLGIRTKF